MDSRITPQAGFQNLKSGEEGFSLVESLIAILILAVGLVGVLAMMIYAVGSVNDGQQMLVAKQKAREAMENIFSARDTGQITFAQIQNQAPSGAGIFLAGFQPLKIAGADGIIGTSDDGTVEVMTFPGGTTRPMSDFERQIAITGFGTDPNMRSITVTVRYAASGGRNRQFQISTILSSYR